MFSVRKARASDRAAIDEMAALFFPNAHPRDLSDDRYLVAEKDGILIGFCHYRLREKRCYVAGLGVLAHYREHGVGGQLLAEAIFDAEKRGSQETVLRVRALNHASKLYHDMGFVEKKYGDTMTLVRKRPS